MVKEDELKKVVATPFKKKNKEKMNKKSFIFSLALDLNWFSLEEAQDVVDTAFSKNLLKEEKEELMPNFSVNEVSSSLSFKPNKDFLNKIKKTNNSLLDRVIERIQENNDLTKQEIVSKANGIQKDMFKLIDVEVATLFVAKEKGVNVSDLINEKIKELN